MAAGTVTPRQQEILDIIKGQPEITAAQIADILDTSEQAIYSQMSRLRSKGKLPKTHGRRGRPRANERAVTIDPEAEKAVLNGGRSVTVEDYLAGELIDTVGRIEEIEAQSKALAEEKTGLVSRRNKLDAAQKALTG